jgi:hypothetical protein
MALHAIKLPKTASHLFRVVALQKRLLKALCDPALTSQGVDCAWLQGVWRTRDGEWVRRFCLGGTKSPLCSLKAIAQASVDARKALYEEFTQQNRVAKSLQAGGDFKDIGTLNGFDPTLVQSAHRFFTRCYELLSHNQTTGWYGYQLPGNRTLSNRSYKDDFTSELPTKVVCPYCDGEIGTPKLDHYLCKKYFPLLACSPWNLVPVCSSCNELSAKGDRLALTIGPPRSMLEWLHPFFREASNQVQIRLNGVPKASMPRLYSPDSTEQIRLDNHTDLIHTLSQRWTNKVTVFFDTLVGEVSRRLRADTTVDGLVRERLEDFIAGRGRTPSALVYASVCQAVLDRRPEYFEEFFDSNPPTVGVSE